MTVAGKQSTGQRRLTGAEGMERGKGGLKGDMFNTQYTVIQKV